MSALCHLLASLKLASAWTAVIYTLQTLHMLPNLPHVLIKHTRGAMM